MCNESIKITAFADEVEKNLEVEIATAHKNDLKSIEMRRILGKDISECSITDIKKAKGRLDEEGIAVSSVASSIGKIKITDPFEPHFGTFKKMVEFAKILQTKYIRIFSFYIPEGCGKAQYSGYRDEVMRRLGIFRNYAVQQDIVLLHENEKGIFGSTIDGCLDIMRNLGGPNFKFAFDFANFIECRQDTSEAYQALKEYIMYVHIKDANLDTGEIMPAGMGDGHLKLILFDLKKRGYSGYLSVEPHLTQYKGFTKIVKNGEQLPNRVLAFDMAVRTLKALLWDIDWR